MHQIHIDINIMIKNEFHIIKMKGINIYLKIKIHLQKKTTNDPSAGSPTDALLRLLLPLDDQVSYSSPTLYTKNQLQAPH